MIFARGTGCHEYGWVCVCAVWHLKCRPIMSKFIEHVRTEVGYSYCRTRRIGRRREKDRRIKGGGERRVAGREQKGLTMQRQCSEEWKIIANQRIMKLEFCIVLFARRMAAVDGIGKMASKSIDEYFKWAKDFGIKSRTNILKHSRTHIASACRTPNGCVFQRAHKIPI